MKFDFRNTVIVTKENELSINNILSKVSEVMLWRFYLNTDFKIGIPFCATYRKDSNPSFSIFLDRRNRLMGKDFGRDFYGDVFNYISMLFNITTYESLIKVNHDFNLGLLLDTSITIDENIFKSKPLTKQAIKKLDKLGENVISESNKIQVSIRHFEESDLNYWLQYGITYKTLKLYNVYCAGKVYCNNRLCYYNVQDNPCYVYHFTETNHVKVYFPFQKSYRFMGNVNNYQDIQGYYQCDVKSNKENKFLILTKSMKDVMTLREFGIDAMAIHGEEHRFHTDFIRHIKKYYPIIISLYDRDITGIKGAKYLWKEFAIPANFIAKKYNCKDISDFYKKFGKEETQIFLNKINPF